MTKTTLDELIISGSHTAVNVDMNINLRNQYTAKAYLKVLNNDILYIYKTFPFQARDDLEKLERCSEQLKINYFIKFHELYTNEVK